MSHAESIRDFWADQGRRYPLWLILLLVKGERRVVTEKSTLDRKIGVGGVGRPSN